jgi:MYXO-CTERM domain-containing protein
VMPTTTSTVSATSTSVTGFGGTGAVITASTVTSSVGGTAGGESESGCACRTTPVSSRGWLLGAGLTLLGLLCSRRQHRLTARGRLFSGTT